MKYDLNALDRAIAAYVLEKDLPGATVSVRGPEGVILKKDMATVMKIRVAR